jgi:hypothetical protein
MVRLATFTGGDLGTAARAHSARPGHLNGKGLIMSTNDWYQGFCGWDNEHSCVPAVRPLLAELAGAGVVAADSAEATWYGATNHPGKDVTGDGRRCDVKRAWLHRPGVLGFAGPGRAAAFDPAQVDEIVLVWLEDEEITARCAYLPDGTVTLTAAATPRAVYRVPVPLMNEWMGRDGTSVVRWLVDLAFIAGRAARQQSPPAGRAA